MFLHDCANAMWSLKGPKGLHLSTLVTFLCQIFLITLQKMHLSSILSQMRTKGLVTSQLPPLQDTSHHHGQSIASHRFLTYKYGRLTRGGRLWTWRNFQRYFQSNWCHVPFPFSWILLLCTFL
jgi:hypothetical protein